MDPEVIEVFNFVLQSPAAGGGDRGALGVGGSLLHTWLRIKNGYPLSNSWGMALHPKTDRESIGADQAADQRERPASRRARLGQGPAREGRADRHRHAVQAGARNRRPRRSTREAMRDGRPDQCLHRADRHRLSGHAADLHGAAASSPSAKSSSRPKPAWRRKKRPNMPPATPSLSSACGCSNKSSPMAVSQTAAQIEALRDQKRIDAGEKVR